MAHIILVTGGSRSGKSEFARNLAESLPGPRAFIATCPETDDEIKERIRKHKKMRSASNWRTIEEQHEITSVLENSSDFPVLLVDCLTLWINNLMQRAYDQQMNLSEEDIAQKCSDIIRACRKRSGTVIFVTNEVGLGIVPQNQTARLFRDLVGTCNQIMAKAADEVFLISCGLSITLKKGSL